VSALWDLTGQIRDDVVRLSVNLPIADQWEVADEWLQHELYGYWEKVESNRASWDCFLAKL
jgi:hypothetical protein